MWNWFLKVFITKLLEYSYGLLKKEVEAYRRKKEQRKKDEQSLQEYTELVKKPGVSKEEIAKKAEELINDHN